MVTTGLVAVGSAANADDSRSETVYNSMPASPAGSYPSQAFTATQTSEFGDYIRLGGENRVVQQVTLGLNSWACESGGGDSCVTTPGATFNQEVTLTFYAVAGTESSPEVGAELGSITKTAQMPFRPSADPEHCSNTSQWYNPKKGTCHSGYRFTVGFDFSEADLVLPSDVIVSVKYPTHTYGPGEAHVASDSLNVDLVSDPPSVGTDVDPNMMFIKSNYAGYAGSGGVGVFSSQTDWSPYALDLKITAAPQTDADVPAAYLNGFEAGDSGLNGIRRVVDGSGNITAAAGCYYAEAPVTTAADATVFTRYAGYTTEFPDGGYETDADFYLDTDATEGQFSWSSAANGTDGNHQRDFIFHAGSDGDGTWTVGVSNNAANTAPWISSFSVEPLTVTESGWYTFQHKFYEKSGRLYVAMAVLNDNGTQLAKWTLGGDASDTIPAAVGGNRYGWLVNNSFAKLPIDNVRLDSPRPTNSCGDYFTDVHKGFSGYAHIQWMGYAGISTGYTDGSFRPDNTVIRRHMANFLWNYAGKPTPDMNELNGFTDVKPGDASSKAIAWLAGAGITTGNADGTYGGGDSVTRKQMAQFLYRLAGAPSFTPPAVSPFTDVKSTDTGYKAMAWLAAQGIATGYEDGTYKPNTPILRKHMAFLLHRFDEKGFGQIP